MTLLKPTDLNWSLKRGVEPDAARAEFARLSDDVGETLRSIKQNLQAGTGSVWMALEDESARIQRIGVDLIERTFLDPDIVNWLVEHESHMLGVQPYLQYLEVTASRISTIQSKLAPSDVPQQLIAHAEHENADSGWQPLIQRQFKVALSFTGEKRPFVAPIATDLRNAGVEVFYDAFFEAELAQPNLDVLLQTIYHDRSELIVVFICDGYERKEWCGLEWRALRDLIKRRRAASIMLMRFDDTDVSGIFSIDGYVDLRNRTFQDAVRLIHERLHSL